MPSSQIYTPLAIDNKSHEEEVFEEYSPSIQRQRRLPFALAFASGLLIGILGTYLARPIVNRSSSSVSQADVETPNISASPSPSQYPTLLPSYGTPDIDIAGPDGLDLSALKFLKIPLSDDPICGKNRHEAKTAGCHYDLLATRWYNGDCYNPDVMQEFFEDVGFELPVFYEDPEFTKPVSYELAMSGDWDLLWPKSNDYHIMHCLYQFHRFHRAILLKRPIDDDVFSYEHTLHCTRMIMDWPNEILWGKNTTTIIDSRVSYCLPGTAVSQA